MGVSQIKPKRFLSERFSCVDLRPLISIFITPPLVAFATLVSAASAQNGLRDALTLSIRAGVQEASLFPRDMLACLNWLRLAPSMAQSDRLISFVNGAQLISGWVLMYGVGGKLFGEMCITLPVSFFLIFYESTIDLPVDVAGSYGNPPIDSILF